MLLPGHCPACFSPVLLIPLVPAARDVLGHLSARLLKHFSLCFSHIVSSHRESFPPFASWKISPHSSRSSCNASSSLQPSLIATVCVNYPFLRIPTLGSWGCCCHPLGASLGVGTGEDLRPASATHCLGNHFNFLICKRGKILQ